MGTILAGVWFLVLVLAVGALVTGMFVSPASGRSSSVRGSNGREDG